MALRLVKKTNKPIAKEVIKMKRQILRVAISLIADIVFGLIASVFAYFVIGEIVPEILNTSLANGAIVIKVDATILKSIFSVWHNFCILFGVRFVVAYICGTYSNIKSNGDKDD